MAVSLFMVALYTILFQMAEVWNWWKVNNNVFFLTNVSAFVYGFLLVATIYAFYLSYPNFLLFLILNVIIDFLQAFVISPFIFQKLGLYTMEEMTNFGLFIMITITVPIIYFFQKWQETIFVQSVVEEEALLVRLYKKYFTD